jgi:acyl-CoA synthetase (AMP-forming)/AMP-acid ligase II
MSQLANIGDALALHARITPAKIGARDLEREMTFRTWYVRACRLANAFGGLGLKKGDRIGVLAYNCVEWLEIYAAAALSGLVAVPINFRLVGSEITYIVRNCEARALIVQDELLGAIEDVRADLPVPDAAIIVFGRAPVPAGFRAYEDLIARAHDTPPGTEVDITDPATLMYTSGTTGNPKGALRSHQANAMVALVTEMELGLSRRDTALLVMPLCHGNSLFFFGAFTYCGAACTVYSRKSFDPEHLVRTLADGGATFTSLVPTHYIMMLALPPAARAGYDLDAVTKLMISSAPARRDTKLAIMETFKNSGLFELYGSTECGYVTMLHPDEQLTKLGSVGLYGSTECGYVTMLHPDEQLTKLGSVGRECAASRPIKLLDGDGNEVPDGEAGELYSCNPQTFDGYWKLPEKTAEAFRGDYCTVGDLARRDEDGYLYQSNMIISGGENVYPSEVETMLGAHPKVRDVAVIGVPDDTWGERVHAVVVLHDGETSAPDEILGWCKDRIAGYKRPRSASFLTEDQMPRTATGKILHRALRDQYATDEQTDGKSP